MVCSCYSRSPTSFLHNLLFILLASFLFDIVEEFFFETKPCGQPHAGNMSAIRCQFSSFPFSVRFPASCALYLSTKWDSTEILSIPLPKTKNSLPHVENVILSFNRFNVQSDISVFLMYFVHDKRLSRIVHLLYHQHSSEIPSSRHLSSTFNFLISPSLFHSKLFVISTLTKI